MRKIIRFPFFGILIGIFPLIALWNSNKSQIYARDASLALWITLTFVIVVSGGFWLIFHKAAKASIAASLFFLLFFSYGHVYNLIEGKPVLGFTIGFVKLMLIYLLLLIVGFVISSRIKKLSDFTVLLLNGIVTMLLIINLAQIFSYEIYRSKAEKPLGKITSQESNPIAAGDKQDLPDIYYIILDAYSRQDVLAKDLHFDNSEFINALRERDFYVAECSNSNYDLTVRSVTSSLNYSFVDDKGNVIDENGKILDFNLSQNRTRQTLKEFGYQFVSGRAYSSENGIPNSDIYLNVVSDMGMKDTIARSQFARMYFETTLLRTLFEAYAMNPLKFDFLPDWLFLSGSEGDGLGYASYWYFQTRYMLDQLEVFPEKEGNYFVYAHLNIPHGPYVFDRNGNFRYAADPEDSIPYYTDAVIYINKRILEVIDSLLSKSAVPPIIILQADHGAHVITSGLEKHKILNAYYLPGDAVNDLYPTITPVNTFRIILRDYFDQKIELLPDTIFAKIINDLEPIPSACSNP